MKWQGRKQSKNVVDKRDPNFKSGTQRELGDANLRQVFNPTLSKSLTKVANRVVRADPMHAKGPGMMKLRSAVKPVNKSTPKAARPKKGK